ncbi:MAG: hypothetical protein NC252_08850 [Roseburia sp.]|nr:hypothetical protein [Roseburia sp.]MCM1419886.1 hypothetical protein [Bacteroides sp.]
MTATKLYILVLFLTALAPLTARAQWGFDVGSVEAYIADHKNQRSLLLARATLEQSNKILHGYSAKAATDYKELNFDLDKYTRAFDVIDVLYQSLRTSMNVYSTYTTVSDRISDYKRLLNDYNDKVLKRNRMELADTVIIKISMRCIDRISKEGQTLYKSVSDLVLYATGAAACSTSDLMLVLESINTSLDNIRIHLNSAYFDTWRYIQVRIGYWKESIYIPQSRSLILEGAFKRWRESGLNPYKK